jgi:integrase
MRGRYKAEQVQPSDIPELKDIIEWEKQIPKPWKFYYFLLACFGLRGTEAHPKNCKLEDLEDRAIIAYAGKTKKWRYVPTCSDELFDALICDPIWLNPNRTPSQMSDDFTKVLNRSECFFTPYALRHHYAYRNLLDGEDTALSARYMGHRIDIHQEVYWLCIDKVRDKEIRKRRFDALPQSSTDQIRDN